VSSGGPDPSARDRDPRDPQHIFRDIVASSPLLTRVLARAPELGLDEWYVGAGCVAGTVWNSFHGFADGAHIKDVDLAYFDASDLSFGAEDRIARLASDLFRDLALPVDVKNEARVHLWYERRFGSAIPPYRSLEDALRTWPTTATSIGIRRDPDGTFRTHAPFGLDDLLGLIVRPNKRVITESVYRAKVQRWRRDWPKLAILPWDGPSP
jgi:hypothetical protein